MKFKNLILITIYTLMSSPAFASLESSAKAFSSAVTKIVIAFGVAGFAMGAGQLLCGRPEGKQAISLSMAGIAICLLGNSIISWLSGIMK